MGTSNKNFSKLVKISADLQLRMQFIVDSIIKKAKVIAHGESLFKQGADARRAIFIKDLSDLFREHTILRDGAKRKEQRKIWKVVEGDIIIVAADIDADNENFLKILHRRDGYASGMVITGETSEENKLLAKAKELGIPTMVVREDLFSKLKDGEEYVFDFQRGLICETKKYKF